MNGKELIKRKCERGDSIECKSGSSESKQGILIHINYKQITIIIQNTSSRLYELYALKNIEIKLPPSTTSNTIEPPELPLPIIPPKSKQDPFKRIDYGLELYYQQIGRNDYKNEDGIGKFIQYIEKCEMDESNQGFTDAFNEGEDGDLIAFDKTLFKVFLNNLQALN